MSSKEDLRLEIKRRLSSISDHEFLNLNSCLQQQFLHFLQKYPSLISQTLGSYLPLKREIQVTAFTSGLRVAYPMEAGGLMNFGIPVEQTSQKVWLKDAKELVRPQWFLVPGLAFDLSGARLGRGKGFYDRYLAKAKGLKVALCLEAQLISDLPMNEFDVRMDFIITENFCWDVSQQMKL